MTRIVGKLSPYNIPVPDTKKPGDLLGVITGAVTAVPSSMVLRGVFDYFPQGGDEETRASHMHAPEITTMHYMGATEHKPMPCGFRVVLGINGKPVLREYTP